MVKTVETLESCRELCNDMYYRLREIHELLEKHSKATLRKKVELDEKLFASVELLCIELEKFDDAFFKEIYKDARKIASLATKNPNEIKDVEALLEKIEDTFNLIRKIQVQHRRRVYFLTQLAKKLHNLVQHLIKDVKELERKWAKKIRIPESTVGGEQHGSKTYKKT